MGIRFREGRRCPCGIGVYTGCPICKKELCLNCWADHTCGSKVTGELAPAVPYWRQRERKMLQSFKALRIDALDMEELIAVYSFGKNFVGAYQENNLPVPEWATENLRLLREDIEMKRRDTLSKALKNAKAKAESLKSTEDKRASVAAEIAELEAQLGGTK